MQTFTAIFKVATPIVLMIAGMLWSWYGVSQAKTVASGEYGISAYGAVGVNLIGGVVLAGVGLTWMLIASHKKVQAAQVSPPSKPPEGVNRVLHEMAIQQMLMVLDGATSPDDRKDIADQIEKFIAKGAKWKGAPS